MNPGTARRAVNHSRYRPGQREGFYESFFQRANHPTRPLAFWIRYTLFSPDRRPEAAVGELWAIFFDGESGRHVAVKEELPIRGCAFDRQRFAVSIGESRLAPGELKGRAATGASAISWDLTYRSDEEPLFLFPLLLYELPLPRAKSLVGVPLAVYQGKLRVDDREVEIDGWVGSQNHNWGTKHTDHYAWGQVAGFDDSPRSFLEVATARLKVGPLWTPLMTPLVLRHGGEEIALNSLLQAIRADGSFSFFDWRFHSENDRFSVAGRISAPRESFVGLNYHDPPGGDKHCLNSKIAACEITLGHKRGGRVVRSETLATKSRAAFEIQPWERDHGVEIRV